MFDLLTADERRTLSCKLHDGCQHAYNVAIMLGSLANKTMSIYHDDEPAIWTQRQRFSELAREVHELAKSANAS